MIRPLSPTKPAKSSVKERKRKCKHCSTPFRTFSSFVTWCSPDCGAEIALCKLEEKAAQARKESRMQDRKRKEEMQPRKWWKAKAKKAMHAYVRARDEGKSCISCETILVKLGRVGGDYDAGHFRSVGSAAHMEFVENNIHGQCKHCNDALKGNRDGYERGLVERFNVEYLDALKNDNETRKLTIDDFKAMEAHYKALLKELLAARAALAGDNRNGAA